MSALTNSASIAVLPVALGEHHLAVEALAVIEILGPQQWVAIPNTPPLLPGALAWRGRAIGIFDLGPALDLPALAAPETRNRNAVLRVSDDTVAMSVDRVLEVRRVEASEIRPVHAASWVVESGLPCRGEIDVEGGVLPLLDLDGWGLGGRAR